MSRAPFRCIALGLFVIASASAAQTSLPKQSPFAPSGGAQAAAATADENLEFAGVSSVGKKTDLIIHDKSSKRKHWISLGETVDGISAVRYDAAREQAVVRINGTEKVLGLRKATRTAPVPAGVPAVPTGFNVPAPIAVAEPAPLVTKIQPPPPASPAAQPQSPATPETQAKAETEARMLVSDLLEIGMAQRKAYEEAQRKGADRGTEPPATEGQVPHAPPPAGTPAQPAPASGAVPPPGRP